MSRSSLRENLANLAKTLMTDQEEVQKLDYNYGEVITSGE